MYAQFLQDSSDHLGKSLLHSAAQNKEFLNALKNEEGLDFTPGEVPQEELPGEGTEEYSGVDTLLGMTNKPFNAHMAKWGLSKLAPKLATKAGMRMIPGLGWALAGVDAIDYFMPQGYGPYDAFGLAPDNAVSDFMSWGNYWDDGTDAAEPIE